MNPFVSWEISSKENTWQGRNVTRWRNEEYDQSTARQAPSSIRFG
jgi:peptide/nickel transport system substrate-binding protein